MAQRNSLGVFPREGRIPPAFFGGGRTTQRHAAPLVGYHIRPGEHDLTEYDWLRFLDFADRHLGE